MGARQNPTKAHDLACTRWRVAVTAHSCLWAAGQKGRHHSSASIYANKPFGMHGMTPWLPTLLFCQTAPRACAAPWLHLKLWPHSRGTRNQKLGQGHREEQPLRAEAMRECGGSQQRRRKPRELTNLPPSHKGVLDQRCLQLYLDQTGATECM